jgi:hypothetical protein
MEHHKVLENKQDREEGTGEGEGGGGGGREEARNQGRAQF